jgi:hypothetical protein
LCVHLPTIVFLIPCVQELLMMCSAGCSLWCITAVQRDSSVGCYIYSTAPISTDSVSAVYCG